MRRGKDLSRFYRRPSDWHDYLEDNKLEEDEMFAADKQRQKAITSDTPNDGVGGIKFKPLNCDDEAMIDYRSVTYCLKQLKEPHDKPLFLACGLHKPHMPWDVPKKYYQMYPLSDVQLPKVLENDLDDVPPSGVRMALAKGDHAAILKSGRWKDAVQGYLATITFCDAMVGRLIDGFDISPYKDNTLVVLWSDHGWHLGEKQHSAQVRPLGRSHTVAADLGRSRGDQVAQRLQPQRSTSCTSTRRYATCAGYRSPSTYRAKVSVRCWRSPTLLGPSRQ